MQGAGQGELQCVCLQGAGMVDSNAFFGANQADTVGIHAAQGAAVHGKAYRAAARLVMGLNGAVGMQGVVAGDEVNPAAFAVDGTVDFDLSRKQGGVVMVLCVQSACGDVDYATFRAVLHRLALVDFCLADGVVHFARVDEAAVDHDARRVGHDDIGLFAGNFDGALQVGGALAAYLVDDKVGFAFGQVRVAADHAAGLCRRVLARVVDDGARRIHVKLAVAVHRDAGIVRRLDVYLRQAVAGF